MCGISGIISTDPRTVTIERLQAMSDALKHRGPQGDGYWINQHNHVGLGHRRLSIIDLSAAGAQPMHYPGQYTITYNGELYNYLELKQELTSKGYLFTSACDTEVVLAAYACYGKDCLQHFDGMFAFAIWNENTQTLFCARDRFGEKPFYYHQHHNQFIFASEMKGLWAAGVPKAMHSGMWLNYLTLGFTNDPMDLAKTFYQGIHALPAAHYLQLQTDRSAAAGYTIQVQAYWDIDKETITPLSQVQAIEQFSHLLTTSVQRRLRSDVAVGTSLSGGLDSSSIVALINQLAQPGIQYQHTAFSAVFPGFHNDESENIKRTANQLKLHSYATTPTADTLLADLQKLIYHQEEPFQSLSIYAQYKVYELAKTQGVTVLLDGQGADETLAGYTKYYHWYWQQLMAAGQHRLALKERKITQQSLPHVNWNYTHYIAARFPALATKVLVAKARRQQLSNSHINYPAFGAGNRISLYKPVVSKLNDLLYFDTMQQGLPELLRYADRNSMAHSREVRLPFLSHELVQFVFSLPADFKIKQGYTKWILRQSMQRKLPGELLWKREKIGFEPPQKSWMQHPPLQDLIHESRRKLVQQQLLKASVLNKPLHPQHAHEQGNLDWRYLCAAATLA